MKRKCAELKRIARDNLTFMYGVPMLAMTATYALTMILSTPFTSAFQSNPNGMQKFIYLASTFIISLIETILSFGLCKIHLGLARSQQVSVIDLFHYFRNHPDRYIIYGLLMFAVTILCMVPFLGFLLLTWNSYSTGTMAGLIVTGILSGILLTLAMLVVFLTQYIMIDHTDLSVPEAFRKSRELMAGNKGRLFYIYLSFIGWGILGLLTFYLGFLWIAPYMSQTLAVFYLDVTGELNTLEQKKMEKYMGINVSV